MSSLDDSSSARKSHRGVRGYACEACARRKIRCDGQSPCSNCARKRGQQCVYSGGQTHPASKQSPPTSQAPPFRYGPVDGRLIVNRERNRSNYVDNTSWLGIPENVDVGDEILSDASDDVSDASDGSEETATEQFQNSPWNGGPFNTLFNSCRKQRAPDLRHLHPSTDKIWFLWENFVQNVIPLWTAVTAEEKKILVSEALKDLGGIRSRTSAFLFVMYLSAVTSISNDECVLHLHERRAVLMRRYCGAAEQALKAARVLQTSDLSLIMTFTLYVIVLREFTDPHTLWALTGVLSRLMMRLGIHRDGAQLNLSPWETEQRRRLWWQVASFEYRIAELAGTTSLYTLSSFDLELPSAVPDDNLHPDMTWDDLKVDLPGDQMHLLVRCELLLYARRMRQVFQTANEEKRTLTNAQLLEQKLTFINDCESELHVKYLRHAEPMNANHQLALLTAKTVLTVLRLTAQQTFVATQTRSKQHVDDEQRDKTFDLALKCIDCQNYAVSAPMFKRWHWHIKHYYSSITLIFLLAELCRRGEGPRAEKAWSTIAETYKCHPQFAQKKRKSLESLVADLVVRAWNNRIERIRANSDVHLELQTPEFVQKILDAQQRRKESLARRANSNSLLGQKRKYAESVGTSETTDGDLPSMSFPPVDGADFLKFGANNIFEVSWSPEDMDYWSNLLVSSNTFTDSSY